MPRWPQNYQRIGRKDYHRIKETLNLRDPLLLDRLKREQREGETRSDTLRRVLDAYFGIHRPPPVPKPIPPPPPPDPTLKHAEHPTPGPVPAVEIPTYTTDYGFSTWIDPEEES